MIYTGQISLPDCVYFLSYSVKYAFVSCFSVWWSGKIQDSNIKNLIFANVLKNLTRFAIFNNPISKKLENNIGIQEIKGSNNRDL